MRELVTTCHTVFEVGANVGDWARFVFSVSPRLRLMLLPVPSRLLSVAWYQLQFGYVQYERWAAIPTPE